MGKTAKIFGIEKLVLFPIMEDTVEKYSVGEGVEIPCAKSLEIVFSFEKKIQNECDFYTHVKKLDFSVGFKQHLAYNSPFADFVGKEFQIVAQVSDEVFIHIMKASIGAEFINSGSGVCTEYKFLRGKFPSELLMDMVISDNGADILAPIQSEEVLDDAR